MQDFFLCHNTLREVALQHSVHPSFMMGHIWGPEGWVPCLKWKAEQIKSLQFDLRCTKPCWVYQILLGDVRLTEVQGSVALTKSKKLRAFQLELEELLPQAFVNVHSCLGTGRCTAFGCTLLYTICHQLKHGPILDKVRAHHQQDSICWYTIYEYIWYTFYVFDSWEINWIQLERMGWTSASLYIHISTKST